MGCTPKLASHALEGLLEGTSSSPAPSTSDVASRGGTWGCALLTSSQVMLLPLTVPGHHTSRRTSLEVYGEVGMLQWWPRWTRLLPQRTIGKPE